MYRNRFFGGFLASLLFFSQVVLCFGDPLSGKQDDTTKEGKNKKIVKKVKGGKRFLHMKEVEIFGNVDKPKAMFIIPRTPHRYYRQEYKRDFSDEILAPISKQSIADRKEWADSISGP